MASGDIVLNAAGDRIIDAVHGDQALHTGSACAECDCTDPCPPGLPDFCRGGGCTSCCGGEGPLCLRVRIRGFTMCPGCRIAKGDPWYQGLIFAGNPNGDYCARFIRRDDDGTCVWGISTTKGPVTLTALNASFSEGAACGQSVLGTNSGFDLIVTQNSGTRLATFAFCGYQWTAALDDGDFCESGAPAADLRGTFNTETCDRSFVIHLGSTTFVDPPGHGGTIEVEPCLCDCHMGKCQWTWHCTFNCDTQTFGDPVQVAKSCNAFRLATSTGWYVTDNPLVYEMIVVGNSPFNCDNTCPDGAAPDKPTVIADCGYKCRNHYQDIYNCITPGWEGPGLLGSECIRGATNTNWTATADPLIWERYSVDDAPCDPLLENPCPSPTVPDDPAFTPTCPTCPTDCTATGANCAACYIFTLGGTYAGSVAKIRAVEGEGCHWLGVLGVDGNTNQYDVLPDSPSSGSWAFIVNSGAFATSDCAGSGCFSTDPADWAVSVMGATIESIVPC